MTIDTWLSKVIYLLGLYPNAEEESKLRRMYAAGFGPDEAVHYLLEVKGK